jgi:hypothetical protein
VAGWSYQWISQLDWASDSWTAPLDAERFAPGTDATTATTVQVRCLVDLLPTTGDVPLFVFDAGYDCIALGSGLAEVRAQVLVRISSGASFTPCWRAFLRRFDIEHTYRFAKGTLGWTTPALRTPEPSRPTGGPGSSSPPTPSCDWPTAPSTTSASHGSAHSGRHRSLQRGSGRDFGDCVPPSGLQPVHRNPPRLAQDARKAPENHREPAIQLSKGPLEQVARLYSQA